MKSLFLLLLGIILYSTSYAQVLFGPRVGVNISQLNWVEGDPGYTKGIDPHNESIYAWHVGNMFSIDATKKITFRAGILLNRLGSKQQYRDQNNTLVNKEIGLTYLNVPLDFVLSIPVYRYNKLQISVGNYFQYCLGGNVKMETNQRTTEHKAQFNAVYYNSNAADYNFARFDLGINVGLGLKVPQFLFMAQAGLGLFNTRPTPPVNYNSNTNIDTGTVDSEFWTNINFSVTYFINDKTGYELDMEGY